MLGCWDTGSGTAGHHKNEVQLPKVDFFLQKYRVFATLVPIFLQRIKLINYRSLKQFCPEIKLTLFLSCVLLIITLIS